MAEKEAQEKKAKEALAAAEAATVAKAKRIADDAAKKATLATSNAAGVFVSEAADKERQHYKSVLDYIHNEVVVAIDSNKAVKKSCADAKREIVPLIGQLINVRDEILRVVRGGRVHPSIGALVHCRRVSENELTRFEMQL
jgi:hypothetical protein